MLKNSQGKPDALLTFAAGAVAVVVVKVLLNGASFHGFAFGTIDGALVGTLLGATLGAYTAKRVVGGKNDAPPPQS